MDKVRSLIQFGFLIALTMKPALSPCAGFSSNAKILGICDFENRLRLAPLHCFLTTGLSDQELQRLARVCISRLEDARTIPTLEADQWLALKERAPECFQMAKARAGDLSYLAEDAAR